MAARPRLQTDGLLTLSEEPSTATSSPARGKEMRTNLLQKLRPPPLVHVWDFWHEKPTTSSTPPTIHKSTSSTSPPRNLQNFRHAPQPHQDPANYTPDLTVLHSIPDVRAFWSLFNNFDFTTLPLRSSCHLFHTSIKPLWEDPRNLRGGSWTFRIPNDNNKRTTMATTTTAGHNPKQNAIKFFQELCLLAIGEQLQAAVTEPERTSFKDDICGVSFSARFGSCLVQVWNRDGGHEEGVKRLLECIMGGLPEELRPKEGNYYYKRHCEHVGFNGGAPAGDVTEGGNWKNSAAATATGNEVELDEVKVTSMEVVEKVEQMEKEVQKVRDILEDVRINSEGMNGTLAMEVGREEGQVEEGLTSGS